MTWVQGGGGGIADGDKGDITVSGSGATWDIDAGVVTTTELGGDITAAGKALLDDADAAAQRTTLGAAAASHTHAAADLTSGTIATARLGSGSATSSTFLRGDQSWATPAASVAMSSVAVAFTDGDTARRVTVTDAAVSPSSKILLTPRRADVADADDPGWVFVANVVSVGTGTFDVWVVAQDYGLASPNDPSAPNETLTLLYTVA